jgi:hypothetical protein
MKGIAKHFKTGDIESLFYFYLCFVCLSEIFVIVLLKKMSHITNAPFDYWTCFLLLVIVPLVETFLLGFVTEALNFIFFKKDCLNNNFFSFMIKITKIPFISFLLLIIFFIYIMLNIDNIFYYLMHSNKLFLDLCFILFITLLTGFFVLFILKLLLTYKLKVKTMNYQFDIEKHKKLSSSHYLKIK